METGKNLKLCGLIYGKFSNLSDFANALGWHRQKITKFVYGTQTPDIVEADAMAKALGVTLDEIADIFLTI